MFVLVAPQLAFDLGSVVAVARERAGIKHEVVAALMGLSASQLADQIAGRKSQHVSFNRMCLLLTDRDGLLFLTYLWLGVVEAAGWDVDWLLRSMRRVRLAQRLITNAWKPQAVKAEMRGERTKEVA